MAENTGKDQPTELAKWKVIPYMLAGTGLSMMMWGVILSMVWDTALSQESASIIWMFIIGGIIASIIMGIVLGYQFWEAKAYKLKRKLRKQQQKLQKNNKKK